ncbi:MAG: aldehyde dehydrogenase family protein, partial [Candidatus Dadabacteria bacterium]|nr:aldehyde dehydrogenase family protein [Candidatus Dadabacteria bacterium]
DELPLADWKQANKMLNTARKLADDKSKSLPVPQRIEILERSQQILKERYDSIVQTACKEGGKPFIDTQVEITRSINGFGVTKE